MLAGLVLVIRQPWQHRTKVLSARIPQSGYTIELWEQPLRVSPFAYEYETWFVVRPPGEGARWYLIDSQYITFRDVALLLSPDKTRVRLETDGRATDWHMIAEFDLRRGKFRAASEQTVQGTKGWTVLCTEHIR
jgi:hypothetical protein